MPHPAQSLTATALLALATLSPALAKSSSHREFDGTIVEISRVNIKVHGVEGGKAQTLGFEGNFTKQANLHKGEYVRVIFDQKFLGLRHADAVAPYGAMKLQKH